MHYIYSYLITGLIVACFYDCFMREGLEEEARRVNQPIPGRVMVSIYLMLIWLPLFVKILFKSITGRYDNE